MVRTAVFTLLLVVASPAAVAGSSVIHGSTGPVGEYAKKCVSRITKQTSDEYLQYGGLGLDTRAQAAVAIGIQVDRNGRILKSSILRRFDGSKYGEYAREAISRVGTCGSAPPLAESELPLTIVVSFGAGLEGNPFFNAP